MVEHVTEEIVAHARPDIEVDGATRKSSGRCAAENVKMAGNVAGDGVGVKLGSPDLDVKGGNIRFYSSIS